MRDNPVQFAVVREDPSIEAELVRERSCRRVLLVASGGCTALALQALFPDLELTLVDPNPAQLDLVARKMEALESLDGGDLLARFDVGAEHDGGLCSGGNFESLFRGWRGLIHDLGMPREEVAGIFSDEDGSAGVERLTSSRWWPVAFDLYFSDGFLSTMFGPDATQHAVPGSYPTYFRRAIEGGLRRESARDNYFLHHVLLGHYLARPEALPVYLTRPVRTWRCELREMALDQVEDLGRYDLISLSNIFDWMPKNGIEELAKKIVRDTGDGATIVYRQLNNERDLEAHFAEAFDFASDLGARLHAGDRSCFYSSVHVGRRRG